MNPEQQINVGQIEAPSSPLSVLPSPNLNFLTENTYWQAFAEAVPNTTDRIYILIGAVVFIACITSLIRNIIRSRKQKKMIREVTQYVLLQVSQVRDTETDRDPVREVQIFEDLLYSIIPEKKPVIFEMAIANKDTDIRFLLAVPPDHVEITRHQVRRVFPRANVQEITDYTIFDKDAHTITVTASLKQFFGLPIHTYKKAERDTFAPILGVFGNASEKGTGMAMQLVLERAPKNAVKEIKSTVKRMEKGEKLNHIHPITARDSIEKTLNTFKSTKKDTDDEKKKKDEDKKPDPETEKLQEKMQQILFRVNVRFGISSAVKEKTEQLFRNIKDQFKQFGPPGHNSFVFTKKKSRKMNLDFTFRLPDQDTGIILSAEEVSSIFHVVSQNIEISNLQWDKTKRIAAPTEIGEEGLVLGDNIFHGRETPVYIPHEDRMRHFHIIGQTGTGKTATIQSMVYQDIVQGRGACVIDPHGDLVDDLLALVPENRLDDVVLFNPEDIKHPLTINMLQYDKRRPEQKSFITDELLSIFHILFDLKQTGGPMFEYYIRNSLMLLMDAKQGDPATLMDLPSVLTNDAFRAELLMHCTLPNVKRFWKEEAEQVAGDASLANIAPYINSKLASFISNEYMLPIINKPYSSFEFREIMDTGKLLLVKLPQGKIGTANAQLLGMMISGKIAISAFSRDEIPEHQRKDFYLYIDEFQNFTTETIGKVLSEARKYRLSLTLGHQFMGQLPDDIRTAVLGNVGTTIAFRIGIEDAEVLEKAFTPALSAFELAGMENLNCAVSMLSHSVQLPPFTMKVRFAPRAGAEARIKARDMVVRYTQLKHGKR